MSVPDHEPWAETAFGDAALGDARRTARVVALARVFGAPPTASWPAASHTAAMRTAAYRCFATDASDPAAMLARQLPATSPRLQPVPLVLAVQETTRLDWTHHPASCGVGPRASATPQGVLAHPTLAITPERVPLGLLAQAVWARDAATSGQQVDHNQRASAEQASQQWLTSGAAVSTARERCPAPHFGSGGDREADGYDLCLQPRPVGSALLVRAAWDRNGAHPDKDLWAAVAPAPVAATPSVRVPRRGTQPARVATLTVRWRPVTLRPPKRQGAVAGRHGRGGGGGRGTPASRQCTGGVAAGDDGASQGHRRGSGARGVVCLPLGD